jgi:hypothetical protein
MFLLTAMRSNSSMVMETTTQIASTDMILYNLNASGFLYLVQSEVPSDEHVYGTRKISDRYGRYPYDVARLFKQIYGGSSILGTGLSGTLADNQNQSNKVERAIHWGSAYLRAGIDHPLARTVLVYAIPELRRRLEDNVFQQYDKIQDLPTAKLQSFDSVGAREPDATPRVEMALVAKMLDYGELPKCPLKDYLRKFFAKSVRDAHQKTISELKASMSLLHFRDPDNPEETMISLKVYDIVAEVILRVLLYPTS